MNVSLSNCPVPPEQLPLNEYQNLKESWFFHWSTMTNVHYIQRVLILGSLAWGFCLPFAREAFIVEESWVKWLIASKLGADIFLLLVVMRLYLGWHYIGHRLENPLVEYEETGWYDGQSWPKPKPHLDRDRLICNYEVRPLLHRLLITLVALVLSIVLGIFLWHLASVF